jgi:hypothetical protein
MCCQEKKGVEGIVDIDRDLMSTSSSDRLVIPPHLTAGDVFLKDLNTEAFRDVDAATNVSLTGQINPHLLAILNLSVSALPRDEELTVLEVGAGKGLTTNCFAAELKRMGFSMIRIVSIDTWLGSAASWISGATKKTGYQTFIHNAKLMANDDVVHPFPIASIDASEVLAHFGVTADVIYINATYGHEQHMSYILDAYYPLLQPEGTMIGNDYSDASPILLQSVNEHAARNGLTPHAISSVWCYFPERLMKQSVALPPQQPQENRSRMRKNNNISNDAPLISFADPPAMSVTVTHSRGAPPSISEVHKMFPAMTAVMQGLR